MAWAEFEEKEYETAALGELMQRGDGRAGFAFSAGQVLEKIVGYDAAAAPDVAHVVWKILQVPRPPGVRLLPSFWQPGTAPFPAQLPQTAVTLILQFKRPEYLSGATAAQRRFWDQPYFRFTRAVDQHRVLSGLERNVGNDALVRYAAPALWKRGQLEAAHLRGHVINESGFLSPLQLARHKVWTYIGPGIDGRANPSGIPAHFEAFPSLLAALVDRSAVSTALVPAEAFGEQFERVGRAASAVARPSLRRQVLGWQRTLHQHEPSLSTSTVQRIGSIAMLTTVLAQVGATWLSSHVGRWDLAELSRR